MARGFVDQQFIQEINKNSLFGHCSPDDFVTADAERKERDRKVSEDRRNRTEEAKRIDLIKKKQEHEDYLFACEEQKRLNLSNTTIYSTSGRGRAFFEIPQQNPLPKPKGRGRLTQSEKEKLDEAAKVFKKEAQIKNQLKFTYGSENYHSNNAQTLYWHGQKSSPAGERFLNGTYSPENFEDAESASSSSVGDSPAHSSKSCSTTSSSSPAPEVFPPPVADLAKLSLRGPVRKRGSRLAANFSNPFVDEDIGNDSIDNNNRDEVFTSSERHVAPYGFRNGRHSREFSFNDLNPSLRTLDDDLFQSAEDLLSGSPDSFTYKQEEFPPLK